MSRREKLSMLFYFTFALAGSNKAVNLTKLWVHPGDFAKVVGINIFKLLRIGKK